jgi:hypothetical protein
MNGKFERTFVVHVDPERAWDHSPSLVRSRRGLGTRVEVFEARPSGRVRYESLGNPEGRDDRAVASGLLGPPSKIRTQLNLRTA